MLNSIDHFRQQYDIGEQIGRGAFAICYKAIHKKTRTVVAAKKIAIFGEDESNAQNISNEISLLRAISHAHIIGFISAYACKSYAIILTEYVQGRDLQHKISQLKRENKRLTQKQLMETFRQILEGLAYLHSNNIIHRDIKPSNLFVDHLGQIKIGDLGASKIIKEFNFTRIGTPYYLSPEIIRHQNYSFPADIWSLGVTLYHLAYLQPPFKASNVIKLGQMIVENEPKYLPQLCSARVEKAIRKMLLKNQKERPTAQALLQQFFKGDEQDERSVFEVDEGVSHEQSKQDKGDEILQTVLQFELNKDEEEQFIQESELDQPIVEQASIYQSMDNSHNQEIVEHFAKPLPLAKRLTRTRSIENRFMEKKLTHIGKQVIDQNESTIVLTVNPTDSRHQSSAFVQSSQKKTFLSNKSLIQPATQKKTSCFKDCVKVQSSSTSNFFQLKVPEKCRERGNGHKRQQSAIQKRQKHSELMQKIKPLKIQTGQRFYENQANEEEKRKPKVTIDVPSFVVLR